jgi:hypothetical protein
MQKLPLPERYDPDRLPRLLDLVGPTEAQAFLTQLDRDLSDCANQLAAAAPQQDWTMLREASHVLMSLAGSTGALALQSLARALNTSAHDRDATTLAAVYAGLAPDLARLIAVVRATPDPFASNR